jgi:hypothetical protein
MKIPMSDENGDSRKHALEQGKDFGELLSVFDEDPPPSVYASHRYRLALNPRLTIGEASLPQAFK